MPRYLFTGTGPEGWMFSPGSGGADATLRLGSDEEAAQIGNALMALESMQGPAGSVTIQRIDASTIFDESS